ncbi:hypothetical protein [Paraburkholderia youngii]|uniref:hypothetical protein n=1 Tax=Paraburkholderia youngii TaxID=2782701 RepID=UPI003D210D84
MLGLIVTILISQHAAGEAKERVVQRRSVQRRAALGCILRQSKRVTCDAGDPVRERPVFSWFNAMVPTYLVHLGTQQMGFVASASALGDSPAPWAVASRRRSRVSSRSISASRSR